MAPAGRPAITQVLMDTAETFAARSTCSRLHVGSVIARSGRIISTGYNGAPSGMPHCNHSMTEKPGDSCTQVVHAEANAICFAARHGVGVDGAQLYCTHSPCIRCATMIVNCGIEHVWYRHEFRDVSGIELLFEAGVKVSRLSDADMMMP